MAPMPPPGGGTTGQTVSPEILGRWAADAGFSGDDLVIAVAVALAESGGRSDAVGTNGDGTRDYGAWQINDRAHADLFDRFPQWGYGPDNARMAHAVWAASGWSAWTTYKNGKYRAFMDQGRQGAANPNLPTQQGNVDTVVAPWLQGLANGVLQIAQAVFKGGAWAANPHNWVRASLVGLGGALVVGALVIVAKPVVDPAIKVAKKAVA